MNNIVGHIYSEEKSISYHVLNPIRVIIFPWALIEGLVGHRVITVLTGRIIQKSYNHFQIERYLDYKVCKNTWWNISWDFFKSLKSLFEKPKQEYSCWSTPEGDYVRYVPHSRLPLKDKLSRKEFLKLTRQTESQFKFSESIKYSGC